jgi:hypothetical protein
VSLAGGADVKGYRIVDMGISEEPLELG